MKVIQINGNAYRGSTGKIVRQISDCLDSRQAENFIICSGFKEKALDNKTITVSSKFSKKIHQFLGYLFGDTGFHSFFVTKKVIRKLKQEKPDIVHLHHLEGYFLNVAKLLRYLKKTHTKTVWTLHDCWAFTGHCTHFLTAKCHRWQYACRSCPQKKKYPYSLLFDRSHQLYNRKKNLLADFEELYIVNVSKWMSSITQKSFLKGCPSCVIYNGIDTTVFSPETDVDFKASLGYEGKYIILGVATTWSEAKGLNVFIELSKYVAEDVAIVLVGMTKEQSVELPSNVYGISRTSSQQDLRKYYCAADVFLSLSLEETMGLVTVEALACGTPAVVCNSSASPELIGENCGEILSERTIENILKAIDNIRTNSKKYYSKSAREFAVRHFSEEQMKEKYYALYEELLRNPI